jgi:hypothetical protein
MEIHIYKLVPNHPRGKKMLAIYEDKHIYFGAAGMSDYTLHKDPERKKRYIARHKAHENWTKTGISTAGFYSRWILWNLPTISESAKSLSSKFGVKVCIHRGLWE